MAFPIITELSTSFSLASVTEKIILAIGLILIIPVILLVKFLAGITIQLWDEDNATYFVIAGAIIVLVSGYGLNVFKRKSQMIYGMVEIVFAITSSMYYIADVASKGALSADHTVAFTTLIVPVGSAIYLTQRGFGNFYDGLGKLKAALGEQSSVPIFPFSS